MVSVTEYPTSASAVFDTAGSSTYGCWLDAELLVTDTVCMFPAVPSMQQLSTVAAVAAHEKDINAVAFSPNDALLATASQDRTVKLWKLPHLVLVQTLRGHKRGVWDVTFSPVDQVSTAG